MKQLKELKLNDTVLTADEVEQKINSAVSGGAVGDELCVTRVCATVVRAGSARANQADVVGNGMLTLGLNENGTLPQGGSVLRVGNNVIRSEGLGGRGSFFFNSSMPEANQVARMVEVNNAIKTALANYKPGGSGGVSSDEFNELVSQVGGKADKSHTHAIGEVTDLTDMLAGKAPVEHTHAVKDVSGLTGAIATLDIGKADKSHTHAIGDVTGLAECLTAIKGSTDGALALRVDAICSSLDSKANCSHTHELADIPKFSDEIERIKGELAAGSITLERFQELAAEVNGKAEGSHKHKTEDVTGLADALRGKADVSSLASVSADLENRKADKLEVESLRGSLGSFARDTAVVHLAGAETIEGVKTFTGGVKIGLTQVASDAAPGELRFFGANRTQQISLKRHGDEEGIVIATLANGGAEGKCWVFKGDSGVVATQAYVDERIPNPADILPENTVYVCTTASARCYVDIADGCNRGARVDVSSAGSGYVSLGVTSYDVYSSGSKRVVSVQIATAKRVADVEERLDDAEGRLDDAEGRLDELGEKEVEDKITSTSTNPVTSKAIYDALAEKQAALTALDTALGRKQNTLIAGNYISIDGDKISVSGLTPGGGGTVEGDYATTEYVTSKIAAATEEILVDVSLNYYNMGEVDARFKDGIPLHEHDMGEVHGLPESLNDLTQRVEDLEGDIGDIQSVLEEI